MPVLKWLGVLLICLAPVAAVAQSGTRFLQKLTLPGGYTAVVAEGDFEARSTGSYSVRVYSPAGAAPGDDTTFFTSGIVRARDGMVEKVVLAEIGKAGPRSLVVTIRSAGTGGYLSADAFSVRDGKISLHRSVADLRPDADVVAALRAQP